MKDLHTVLRQKEQDVERVRQEIQALLTVIPLLENDQFASGIHPTHLPTVASVQPFEEAAKKPQQRESFSQLLTSWLSEGNL